MHSEVYEVHGQVELPQRGRWGKYLQEGRQPALDLQPGCANHWSNKLQWLIHMCSQLCFVQRTLSNVMELRERKENKPKEKEFP